MNHSSMSADRPDSMDFGFARLIEEISDKVQSRERFDISEFCDQYPEYAESLRQLVPSMEMLADCAADESDGLPSLKGQPLGDFRLVREIGRGGMGVVYEAEQLSLRRKVALKVLPFAAMMDPNHLQRFYHEAQSAALLHHPHIVPVYAVGSDRGIHYFAMQLIQGRSLADLISQDEAQRHSTSHDTDRQPDESLADMETVPIAHLSTRARQKADDFREIARLGIQAADALDFAHRQGIVHRDIKPANLLIDQSGSLWVTDFGLALSNIDASITRSEELVGTLRYMSPEQATGKLVLDHRTDIYSLGLTLYELMAGQAAFTGQRQQILHDIHARDPVPLRKCNPRVPAELAVIVNKAIEKHPADRYATAVELQDDLQRFLDHRPIVARAPSITQRFVKWARRNQSLAASAVLLTVGILIASVVCTSLVFAAYRRESAQRQVAQQSQAAAEHNLQIASTAIEQLLVKMAEQAKAGNKLPDAEEFLDDAARTYELLLAHNANDRDLSISIAKGQIRIGEIKDLLGLHEESQAAYESAITVLEPLDQESKDDETLLTLLSLAYGGKAGNLFAMDRYAQAEEPYLQSRRALERIPGAATSDSVQTRLAENDVNLGLIYWTTNRLLKAEESYKRALAVFDADHDHLPPTRRVQLIGATVGNLAILCRERGNLAEARSYLNRAYASHHANFEARPRDPQLQADFYHSVWNDVHLALLERDVERADRESRELVDIFPNRLASYVEAAQFQLRCAELAEPTQRLSHVEVAKRFIEQTDNANVTHREPAYVNKLANLLLDATPVELRDIQRSLELATELVEHHPTRWEFRQSLGKVHYRQGRFDEALAHFQRAVEMHGSADWSSQFWLAMTYAQLGDESKAADYWDDVKDYPAESVDTEHRVEFFRLRGEATSVVATANLSEGIRSD